MNRIHHTLRSVVLLLVATLATPIQNVFSKEIDAPLSNKVDALFKTWDNHDSPGFAVGVIRNGKFIHKGGYGMANLGEGIPITSETTFDAMSLAKSFSTACVALLLDEGALSPDEDIRKYIPELPQYNKPITVRHLVTCRSGLRDYWFLMTLLGRSDEDAYTSDDIMDLIVRQKTLMFSPGEKFGYSNSDYFLLSRIIEKVTGKSYGEVMAERIFRPLQMTHAYFDNNRDIPQKNHALGHFGNSNGDYWRLGLNRRTVGPGGLRISVEDMLRWEANFKNPAFPPGKYINEFLQQGSLFGNLNCLAAFREDYKGLKRTWYTGGGMGFHAHFVRFPEHELSIVAFGNVLTERAWGKIEQIIPMVTDLYLSEETKSESLVKPEWNNAAPHVKLSGDEVKRIASNVGAYRNEHGAFRHLKLHGQQLVLTDLSDAYPTDAIITLKPIGPRRFRTNRGFDDIDLLFEHQADATRTTVRVEYSYGAKEKWGPIELVKLDDEQLADYLGKYYCDDMESVYRVSTADEILFIQFNYGRKRELLPTLTDSFIFTKERFNGIVLEFFRNESDKIAGFDLEFGRIKSLRFEKQ